MGRDGEGGAILSSRKPRRVIAPLAILSCVVCLLSSQAKGQPPALPLPGGLTAQSADLAIHGVTRPEGTILLDLATVMAFPSRSFTCVDPWDGKEHSFTGVRLTDLLEWAGISAQATRITVSARNKYSIPIRRADYEKYEYLLAWKIDGHLFSEDKATKNRGPLSIAIDFGRHSSLDPAVYKHQLVWQVSEIDIE
jgi:hypothetical protein